DPFWDTRGQTPATPRNPRNRLSKVPLDSFLSKARYPDETREIGNGERSGAQDRVRPPVDARPEPRPASRATSLSATHGRDRTAKSIPRSRLGGGGIGGRQEFKPTLAEAEP